MWGVDVNGTLGQGGTVSSFAIFTPVTTFAGGADWKQVSCGYRHTAAVKTDGTLWAWGEGGSGRLGNNDSLNNRSTPVTTFSGGTNWKQVSCSYDFTTAVKTDGTLWVWGNNSFSKLGNNETSAISRKATPITTFAGGANWKQVSADCNTNSGIGVAAVKTDGTLWLWGSNSNGQLGNTDLILRSTPITTFVGGTNWKQVCYSDGSTLSLNDNGVNKLLYGFGNNYYGNLGFADGTSFKDVFPTQVEGNFSNWKQVSCSNITGGADPVAAIKTDGTLWVWGNSGSLGTNDTINKSTPVTTFAGGTNWNVVHCATNIMSAIKTDGTLWTWGTNSSAQLGTNDTINKSTPVTTFAGGTNWKQISSAGYSCAAIKTDGTLWVWGNNSSSSEGRLGTNDTINKSTPVTTFAGGSNWTQANMIGYANLILLKTDGTLWLTGSNNNAEFGDNNNKYCIATQIYGNSSDYKQITSNAAIKTDGTLWVWGNNSVPGTTGHLGINDTITQVKITPVTTFAGGNDWKQVESLITNTNVSFMAVKTGLSPQLPL
jgi:alpha-tubulin suppressor-like RCC1 family protein